MKRNILTIKKIHREVCRAKDLSAPLYCEKLFADIKLYEGFSCFVLRNSLKNFSKHIRHTLYNYTINTTF